MPLPKNIPGANSQGPKSNNQRNSPPPSRDTHAEEEIEFSLDDFSIPDFNEDTVNEEPREPFRNEYDPDDDLTFTPLEIDDQLDDEIDKKAMQRIAEQRKNERIRAEQKKKAEEAERAVFFDENTIDDDDEEDDSYGNDVDNNNVVNDRSQKNVHKNVKNVRQSKKNKNKDNENKDNEPDSATGHQNFIDEDNLELLPLGGKKKRKIKENELDPRVNRRRKAMIVQYTALGVCVAVMGFAVKSVFFQPAQLTVEEVEQISQQSAGITNFPLTRGEGYATNFMQAYLTANSDQTSAEILNFYYNGSLNAGSDASSAVSDNRVVSLNFKQDVVFGPTVYEAESISDYSARYTIGAVVKDDTIGDDGQVAVPDGSDPNAAPISKTRWEFFNVNVYYDAKNDTFSILPDSPSIVPATEVGQQSQIPNMQLLGTGESNQELAQTLQSTVYGFLEGYVKSSPTDHSSLDQYIVSDPPIELTQGLNNQYSFAGELNDAVTYEAYPTDDPNVAKVLAKVKWRNVLGDAEGAGKIEYSSTYVITLDKQTNGKYLVSKFQPQYYVQEPTDE